MKLGCLVRKSFLKIAKCGISDIVVKGVEL